MGKQAKIKQERRKYGALIQALTELNQMSMADGAESVRKKLDEIKALAPVDMVELIENKTIRELMAKTPPDILLAELKGLV